MRRFKIKSINMTALAIGLLSAVFVLFGFMMNGASTLTAKAQNSEEKVYCQATINEEFEETKILVTLNKAATLSFKEYGIKDFPEVALEEVRDLTAPSVELAKEQIAAEKAGNFRNQTLLRIEKFRRVLCLTLSERGKENVLHSIKLLETRDDIIAAEPNYVVKGAAVPHATLYNTASQWGLNHAVSEFGRNKHGI